MTRPRTISIIRLLDGAAHLASMVDTLEDMQRLVGGYVEAVQLTPSLTLWVNEEGLLDELPYNLALATDGGYVIDVVGPAFVTRSTEDGDVASVRPDDLGAVLFAARMAQAARLGALARGGGRQ